MDDYSISSLTESKNEWCARLVGLLTHFIIEGFDSIFKESIELCDKNNEHNKYLMTFQNFLQRIPKWNINIIEAEKNRIINDSGCNYLEELITCVHIIKLKELSCVRVGQKQKKIDVNVPHVDDFIHKIYINGARKLYNCVYVYEKDLPGTQTQKNRRELETLIREAILETIRNNIPVEEILRAYMNETEETEVQVEEKIDEIIENKVEKSPDEIIKEAKEEIQKEELQKEDIQKEEIKKEDALNELDDVLEKNKEEPNISLDNNIQLEISPVDKESNVNIVKKDNSPIILSSSTTNNTLDTDESKLADDFDLEEDIIISDIEDDDDDDDEMLQIGDEIDIGGIIDIA